MNLPYLRTDSEIFLLHTMAAHIVFFCWYVEEPAGGSTMEIYVFYKYIEIHGFIGKERNKVRLYGKKSKDIML